MMKNEISQSMRTLGANMLAALSSGRLGRSMKRVLPVIAIFFLWPNFSNAAFIVNETFTTGSRPASWWSGSTGDYGYTTSPAPLEGTYSLQRAESGQDLYQSGTQVMGEQWGHFLINVPTLPASFSHIFVMAYNFNDKYKITLNSSGTLTMQSCAAFETTTNTLSTGTTYHVWWRYKPSTGSNNGQAELWFNTADDRAGTATGSHVSYSSGTCTEGLGDMAFMSENNLTRFIVDKVQWADTDEFDGSSEAVLTSITYPVSNRGLIGYWSFDEGASTKLHDLSGNGNHGTMQNMDANSDWVAGRHGKALDFDGANDYVSVPIADDTNTSLTESLWFYPRELPSEMSSPYQDIIDKEGDTWDIFMYNCGAGCGGIQVKLVFGDNTSQPRVSVSDQYINKNQWNHIVVTYDGTSANLYLNGVLRSTASPGLALLDTANTIYLGSNNQGGSYWFNGKLDDLRIYNRAISQLEVTALYRQGQITRKSVSNEGLVGHWTLNEGASTIAHDFSGRSNNGTITSGTWVPGKKGGALDFNNAGGISVPDNDALDFGTGSFTIAMWGRYESFVYPRSTFMMKKGAACYQAGNPGWDIGHTFYSGGVEACLSDGTNSSGQGSIDFDAGYRPADLQNTWAHLVVVFDRSAGKAKFYVNGVKQSGELNIAMVTGSISNSSGLDIATVHGWTTDGQIDDVRIYNRALSASEAAELYKTNETKINASQNTKATNGLIGMWSFNGKDMNWATNIAYDRSGNSNNGTLINMSTTTSPVSGRVGQSLNFDGTNDYIEVADTAALEAGTSDFSLSAWARPAFSGGADRIIAAKGTSCYETGYGLRTYLSTGKVGAVLENGTNNKYVFETSAAAANEWHHYVFVRKYNDYIELYKDGVSQGTESLAGWDFNIDTARPLRIGASTGCGGGPAEYYQGRIDEVRIYRKALSASEAKQLYLMGK